MHAEDDRDDSGAAGVHEDFSFRYPSPEQRSSTPIAPPVAPPVASPAVPSGSSLRIVDMGSGDRQGVSLSEFLQRNPLPGLDATPVPTAPPVVYTPAMNDVQALLRLRNEAAAAVRTHVSLVCFCESLLIGRGVPLPVLDHNATAQSVMGGDVAVTETILQWLKEQADQLVEDSDSSSSSSSSEEDAPKPSSSSSSESSGE